MDVTSFSDSDENNMVTRLIIIIKIQIYLNFDKPFPKLRVKW